MNGLGTGTRHALRFVQRISIASLLSLAACGGSGGTGEEAPATGSPGSPTPPSTGPSPTPEAATLFSGTLLGSFTGRITFDLSGDGIMGNAGDVTVATNRSGQFGRDVTDALVLDPPTTAPAKALYRMSASGFDNITGHFYSGLTAPAGSTVISPITSLIDAVGSQQKVRQALGLDDGPYAIDKDIDLLSFDTVKELQSAVPSKARDARIVTAINMMILNLGIMATSPGTSIDNSVEVDDIAAVLASMINASLTVRFDDQASLPEFFRRLERFSPILDRSFSGASNILSEYWKFSQPRIVDEESLYNVASLFRYYVAAVIINAGNQFYYPVQNDVNDVELLTTMQYIAEVPKPDVSSDFYALPDYMDNSFDSFRLAARCDLLPKHPKCNDYNLQAGGLRQDPDTLVVTSVSAEKSSNLITVQLDGDGSILITRKPGARGLAYFDYFVKNAEGKTSSSRYYITLRPSA